MCCRSDNGAHAEQVASQIQDDLEPIITPGVHNGVDLTPKPMDSCDAGQLEACAIERFATYLKTACIEICQALTLSESHSIPQCLKEYPDR